MRRGARLASVAVGAWVAALVVVQLPASAPWVACGAWLLAGTITAAVALHRRRGPRTSGAAPLVIVLTAAAVAGTASHVAVAQPARDQAAALAIDGGRAIELDAVVVGKVERRAGGLLAFDARASAARIGDRTTVLHAEIVVRVAPGEVSDGVLDVGARVSVAGTATRADAGDRAVLRVHASRGVHVLAPPTGAFEIASTLRRGLVAAVAGLPEPGAGLVPGLAVGDTVQVSAELDTAMKRSALSHLTAVSGANCALVVGLAFGASVLLGAGRRARVWCGLTALAGFVLLVTPEPSVVRAAAMSAIAMIALLRGRMGIGVAVLCTAVTVLLVADPWLSTSIGFALSAAATGSLLVIARPLATGLTRWMPRPLALGISIPFAAQLACGPLLVLIDPAVPLYGVAANLLAAPAAPVATIVGLAACLAVAFPWLQAGLVAVAWIPAAWIAGIAETISAMPGDRMPWLESWPGAAALTIVSAAVVVVVAGGGDRIRRLRTASVLVVAVVVGVAGGGWALTSVAGRWTVPAEWAVLACDVGQGDAVLLRSASAIALVDTGPEPEAMNRCLTRAGIEHIDLLVLTHFDLDHIGGVPAVVGRVGTVLHGPVPAEGGAAALEELAAHGARPHEVAAGRAGTLGEARWRVVWPPAPGHAFPAGNDASVVLDVRGGGIPSTLLLGDLSAAPQRALRASAALARSYDVVKVAHHGSADQAATLYERLAPAVAVITVGARNSFGHPRDDLLEILDGIGAVVARTDEEGMIALWRDAGAVAVWRDGEVGTRR